MVASAIIDPGEPSRVNMTLLLTHFSWMEFPVPIIWMNPFWIVVNFNFNQILKSTICKQTVQNLIRHRILQRLIWFFTVCRCPIKRTLGLNGLMDKLGWGWGFFLGGGGEGVFGCGVCLTQEAKRKTPKTPSPVPDQSGQAVGSGHWLPGRMQRQSSAWAPKSMLGPESTCRENLYCKDMK